MNPGTKWEDVSKVEAVLYANNRGRVLISSLEADGEDEAIVIQFFEGEAVKTRR